MAKRRMRRRFVTVIPHFRPRSAKEISPWAGTWEAMSYL